jgi:hypothetical protein
MSNTPAPLASFANALLDPGGPVPGGIIAALEPDIKTRFDVYRNNVFASLIDALRDSFPVIEKLLGKTYFRALAREFIITSPPESPVLLEYGAGFAGFIETFPPLQDMVWLADIARLEMAWLDAYHAADAKPLGTESFAKITPGKIPRIRLALHPSAQLVRSIWPILTIWKTNQDGAKPCEVDLDQGAEDVLALRPQGEVELHGLAPGSGAFIEALMQNEPLESAHQAAIAQSDNFDLAANLAHFISSGTFIQVS